MGYAEVERYTWRSPKPKEAQPGLRRFWLSAFRWLEGALNSRWDPGLTCFQQAETVAAIHPLPWSTGKGLTHQTDLGNGTADARIDIRVLQ